MAKKKRKTAKEHIEDVKDIATHTPDVIVAVLIMACVIGMLLYALIR